jgi:hypothetical protein
MRKYKVTVEAEIKLDDYLDDLDLTLFNKHKQIELTDLSDEDFSSEYKFSLELIETTVGELSSEAIITKINVEEIIYG